MPPARQRRARPLRMTGIAISSSTTASATPPVIQTAAPSPRPADRRRPLRGAGSRSAVGTPARPGRRATPTAPTARAGFTTPYPTCALRCPAGWSAVCAIRSATWAGRQAPVVRADQRGHTGDVRGGEARAALGGVEVAAAARRRPGDPVAGRGDVDVVAGRRTVDVLVAGVDAGDRDHLGIRRGVLRAAGAAPVAGGGHQDHPAVDGVLDGRLQFRCRLGGQRQVDDGGAGVVDGVPDRGGDLLWTARRRTPVAGRAAPGPARSWRPAPPRSSGTRRWSPRVRR